MKRILFLLLSLLLVNPVMALSERSVIRVAISNQNFSNFEHYEVKLSSLGIIKVIDMSKNSQLETIPQNSIVRVYMKNNLFNVSLDDKLIYENLSGPLLFNSNSNLQIEGLNRKGDPAKYMGMIELKKSKSENAFNIVNVIDMQNYLRGVVSNEMPVTFGLEALKAQSIAARNYAQNADMSPNYDLVDSTAAQVYYGVNSYRDISDNAVNQTKGIYALYKGKPITALYFSTSPGITDDWDNVFGDSSSYNSHPYLKPKYDKEGQKPLRTEEDVKKFYSSTIGGIDTNSPKYRWNIDFTREELETILNKTLLEQSKTGLIEPKFTKTDKLEGLKEIKPLKRTESGKITELEIIAKSGKYKIQKELTIRRVLKKNNSMLPSANFFVETTGEEYLVSRENTKAENTKNIELKKPEQNKIELAKNEPAKTEIKKEIVLREDVKLKDKIELKTDVNKDKTKEDKINEKLKEQKEPIKLALAKEKYPSQFKFRGGGFGHGVGMSQFGAYNMAKAGKKFPEILKHYYTDINISTIVKEVLFNEFDVHYISEFYFDKNAFKEAYLVIDNKKNASEFPFVINEYVFNETKTIANNKFVKINITQYLKNGLNTVNFAPLTKENKGKVVQYRVEFL